MNLTLSLEEEISLITRYNITPNELLVVRVLLMYQEEDQTELLSDLLTALKDTGLDFREILTELQNKEIILKSYRIPAKGSKFEPLDIPINKNFIKNIYKCSFELGKELFEVYPQFGLIQGNSVPLRSVSRHFDSLEKCFFKYGKAIGFNQDRHKEIIELVKWANDNNLINCALSSFVINQGWLDLKAMKEGDIDNFNRDAIREL